MQREDFAFTHRLRVRWAEVDMQKIVFNGNYMLYFDVGFTEYWRHTGVPSAQQQAAAGIETLLRRVCIDYLAPAEFDDELDVGIRCARLGRSSMTFFGAIFRGDQLLVTGELVYVYADVQARKGVPLPAPWRERLATLEHIAPEQASLT